MGSLSFWPPEILTVIEGVCSEQETYVGAASCMHQLSEHRLIKLKIRWLLQCMAAAIKFGRQAVGAQKRIPFGSLCGQVFPTLVSLPSSDMLL